ncbi:hypothetical protein AAVH_06824 [Aphelenchoides avenae]|nr:hypothetical protein AAVH_06824 [Aphelenchus avenae]
MLPVETFGDVASFLAYYDLAGLKLATKLLSSLANKCADAIRLLDFSDFKLHIYDRWVTVYRFHSNSSTSDSVCNLGLKNKKDMADFIREAFRNCIIRRLVLLTDRELVLNALKAVADVVAVAELRVSSKSFKDVQWLIDIAGTFRGVKVLSIIQSLPHLTHDEEESVKDFCQMKNIIYG